MSLEYFSCDCDIIMYPMAGWINGKKKKDNCNEVTCLSKSIHLCVVSHTDSITESTWSSASQVDAKSKRRDHLKSPPQSLISPDLLGNNPVGS